MHKDWSGEFVCGFLGSIASLYSPVIFPQLATKAEKVETVLHSRTDVRVQIASHLKPWSVSSHTGDCKLLQWLQFYYLELVDLVYNKLHVLYK